MKYFLLIIYGMQFLPRVANAEDFPFEEELQSDRPDFTEGAYVVEKNHFQLEGGYTYSRSNIGESSHLAPEMLLRVGAFEETEIRINWAGYQKFDGVESFTGYSIGTKTKLYAESLHIPRTSIIAEIGPSDSNVNLSQFDAGFKLIFEKEVYGQGLASNVNFFRRDDGSDVYPEASGSLTLGVDLVDNIGSYIEAFSIIPLGGVSKGSEIYFNGGLTFLVDRDLQFDVRGGLGMNKNSDDLFGGAGFVYRN